MDINPHKEKELFLQATRQDPAALKNHNETRNIMERLYNENQLAAIDLKERESIIKMRRIWSWWLLAAIILIVFFDIFLILAIGFEVLVFTEGYFIPIFISESLLKIFGLAIIVVNFLFNKEAVR